MESYKRRLFQYLFVLNAFIASLYVYNIFIYVDDLIETISVELDDGAGPLETELYYFVQGGPTGQRHRVDRPATTLKQPLEIASGIAKAQLAFLHYNSFICHQLSRFSVPPTFLPYPHLRLCPLSRQTHPADDDALLLS